MTDMTATIHTDAGSRSKPLSGLLDFLVAAGASIREGSEVETRYRALARMSSHDLADIGLTRSDIVHAAFIGDSFRPRR